MEDRACRTGKFGDGSGSYIFFDSGSGSYKKNRLIKIKRERNFQTASQIEKKPAGCQSEKETVILQASKRANHLQRRKINTKTATPLRERQINSQSVNQSGKQSIFNEVDK
jgi:hypothetical protein